MFKNLKYSQFEQITTPHEKSHKQQKQRLGYFCKKSVITIVNMVNMCCFNRFFEAKRLRGFYCIKNKTNKQKNYNQN